MATHKTKTKPSTRRFGASATRQSTWVSARYIQLYVALAVAIMNMAGLQKKELQNDSSYDMLHGWQGW